ncbi:MAG: DUF4174 domain-containing protein [Pseudomonadota bacterium]
MKAVALVLVCLNISLVSSAAETLTSLGQLRWENRVLVILPPMAHKQEQLTQQERGVEDRDLIWFVVSNGSLKSNYAGDVSDQVRGEIAARFEPGQPVVLIGKDGGVKARESRLNLMELFSLIDSMPMRRDEIRRGNAY